MKVMKKLEDWTSESSKSYFKTKTLKQTEENTYNWVTNKFERLKQWIKEKLQEWKTNNT